MILEILSGRTQIPSEQLQLRLISQQVRVRGWGLAANAVLCLKQAKKSNFTHACQISAVLMAAVRSRCGHYILQPWFLLLLMAALWNRAGHYIFVLWFLLLSFLSPIFSAVADWMSNILPHMVWP